MVAPICLSATCPCFIKMMVGTLRTPNLCVSSLFSSTSHFPTTACFSYSWAKLSIRGPILLHGPHHVAQKSMTMGLSVLSSSSKLASVIMRVGVMVIVFIFWCQSY